MSTFQIPFDISLLSPVNMGYTDIWKQESADDENLMEYFLETPAFLELKNTKKYIVSGRKGTGKTALKRGFLESFNNHEDVKTVITKDLDSANLFSSSFSNALQEKIDSNYHLRDSSYVDIIGWMIYIQIIFMILKCDKYIPDFGVEGVLPTEKRNILKKLLNLNGYNEELSTIGSSLLELDKIKIDEEIRSEFKVGGVLVGGSRNASEEYKNSSQEVKLEQIKPQVEEFILDLMEKSGRTFYLLIDGLDKTRNTFGDDDLYKKIIVDFLMSIERINEKIRKHMPSKKSRIIAFCRNDMLDLVEGEYDDMGKLRGDYEIKIDWQMDYEKNDSLLNKMIEKRLEGGIKIRQTKGSKKYYTKPLFKNALYSSGIIQGYLSEAISKGRRESEIDVKYFLYNRTMLRPRDYVQFFKFLSISNSPEEFEKNYSDYFKSQTLDEIKKVVHDYERVEKTLKKVCTGKRGSFTGREFVTIYCDGTEDTKIKREADEVLEILYQYGVIGYRLQVQTQTMTRFYYRELDTRNFQPDNLILHSGLWKAYGIT